MSDTPWIPNYDPGIKTTLVPYKGTLLDCLAEAVQKRPNATAVWFKGSTMTWAELDKLSDQFANALVDLGVKKGEPVSTVMVNSPQALVAQLGTWKIGGVFSPLNPIYTERELEELLSSTGSKVIVVLNPFYARIKALQSKTKLEHVIASNITDFLPRMKRILFKLLKEKKAGQGVTLQGMKDAGFKVPEINMNAYMKARKMTQSFIDDYLGYFIDDRNKLMTSLLVGCGLPGGMMGSLMADLKGVHAAINSFLKTKAQPEISEDELLVQLFEEVKFIWPKLGFPPLVTPFSQYVKNIALMNVMNMTMGKGRWQAIDRNSWDMILGKAGKLPGALDQEIIELAKKNNFEFFEGNPQDNYPDELPKYIEEMKKNGWSRGKDDEELFEFAMHDKQYRDFKSGEAKRRFEQELETAIRNKYAKQNLTLPEIRKIMYPEAEPITATASGKILWELDFLDRSIEPTYGKLLNENEMLYAIQTRYGVEAVKGIGNARIISVSKRQGDIVNKGDTICYIERVNTPSEN